jgi:hypothetical protein
VGCILIRKQKVVLFPIFRKNSWVAADNALKVHLKYLHVYDTWNEGIYHCLC